MKGDFKALLRKFCLESSIVGLKYFYLYPDPVSRCFWTVSIVLNLFMSFILTLFLYNRFADIPTRIAIENQYASIQNVSYPAITLCSPNQVTLSAVEHFEKTLVDGGRNITVDLKKILPRLLGFYELFGDKKQKELEYLQNLTSANRYNTLEVLGLMPQNCAEFLKLCYLKGQRYPNCKGVFSPILTKHGMCCIFNSVYHYNKIRNERLPNFVPHTASTGGFGEALTVITDYDPDNALTGTLLNAGAVRVMLTEPHEFPADDEMSLVHAYSESFHFIRATYTYCSEDVTALAYWSRQCYFEHEHRLPHFAQYRSSHCDALCEVRAVERRCRCSPPYVPHVRAARACEITNIDCIVETKLGINKWHSSGSCACLRDCVSMRYRAEVSVGNLMALPYLMHNPYSGIQFNKSTSILHFFFRNSVHERQKQETVMSLITIASNLGGVFGLCLGCSVISVLEIFFYINCAIRNKMKGHVKTVKNNVDFIKHESETNNTKTFKSFQGENFKITPIDRELSYYY